MYEVSDFQITYDGDGKYSLFIIGTFIGRFDSFEKALEEYYLQTGGDDD